MNPKKINVPMEEVPADRMAIKKSERVWKTPEDYFADSEFVSSHMVQDFDKCELFYEDKYILKTVPEPEEEKAYFVFGRAVDALLTQPKEFDKLFVVGNKRDLAKDETRTQLTPSVNESVRASVAELMRQPLFVAMLHDNDKIETQTMFAHTIDGLKRKGMLDIFDRKNRRFIDIKTTMNIETFDPLRYIPQMSWYDELVEFATGERHECYLAVVDKAEGHRSEMFFLGKNLLDAGRAENAKSIGLLKERMASGFFNTHAQNGKDRKAAYQCPAYSSCRCGIQSGVTIIA